MVGRPRIWFERPLLTDLVAETHSVATVLGADSLSPDNPYAGLAEASGVIAGTLVYDAELMDRAPNIRVICRLGIGYDAVDVPAATSRGIAVCNTPDAPTVSTAEQTVALMLAAAKHVKRSEAWLRDGSTEIYARHDAIELDGTTLGLVGYGRIARRVARAAHGLGMRVTAFDPYLESDAFDGALRSDTLEDLLSQSDVVSLHIPMTPQNVGLFGTETFSRMKPGAIFVNTARGGLVDQEALIEALESGHLHSAALDVTHPEPLAAGHPLLERDDVVVTPHVASGTFAGKRRIFRTALSQTVGALSGTRPAHLVNPEVWERVSARVRDHQ